MRYSVVFLARIYYNSYMQNDCIDKIPVKMNLKTAWSIIFFIILTSSAVITWGVSLKTNIQKNEKDIIRHEEIFKEYAERLKESNESIRRKDVRDAEMRRDIKYLIQSIDEIKETLK